MLEKEIHREGFWRSESEPNLPMPIHSDISWTNKFRFLYYLHGLEEVATFVIYKGVSPCRCCGHMIGNREFTHKGFVWPQGLSHYIEVHNVKPSKEFMEFVINEQLSVTARTINTLSEPKFSIGDRVRKVKGYSWPGIVVSVFFTKAGQLRYVVECTVPEVAGALHIYNEEQLEFMK